MWPFITFFTTLRALWQVTFRVALTDHTDPIGI